MENNIYYAIGFAILGSVLSGLAQFSANTVLNRQKDRRKQENYRIVVFTETESVYKQLEKLKNSFNDRGYYPFAALSSLKNRVDRLETNIANVHNTGNNTALQTNFVSTVTDLADLIAEMQNLENNLLIELRKIKPEEGKDQGVSVLSAADHAIKSDIDKLATKAADEKDKELRAFTEQQRAARLVELVDLKRRVETLLDAFRSPKP
jgi:hypothetical protein